MAGSHLAPFAAMHPQALTESIPLRTAAQAAAVAVERVADLDEFLRRWQQLAPQAPTPFHQTDWLRAWYTTIGRQPGIEPVLLRASRSSDGTDLMLLPLIRRRQLGITVVQPPDLGVTDYNGPLLNPKAAIDDDTAGAIWQGIRQALRGCDLLRMDKLLPEVSDQANPLIRVVHTEDCNMFGNHSLVGDDWDAWRHSLGRSARKEFDRYWRVFSREPEARFVCPSEPSEALALYHQLETMQHARMQHQPGYRLAEPAYSRFYEDLLRAGLVNGSVVLTALMSGNNVVAALYSAYDGQHFTMLRLTIGGPQWKHCTPGKLILERSMHHMHEQGCRFFDFAIGDYAHKRDFNTQARPLRDACVALSWLGIPAALAWRAKHAAKRHPRLLAAVRGLRP